jgi:hypothetical protein
MRIMEQIALSTKLKESGREINVDSTAQWESKSKTINPWPERPKKKLTLEANKIRSYKKELPGRDCGTCRTQPLLKGHSIAFVGEKNNLPLLPLGISCQCVS